MPQKLILRLFGAQIAKNSILKGKIRLFEPAWLQLNQKSRVSNILIKGPFSFLIDNHATVKNTNIKTDTIATSTKIYTGKNVKPLTVTLSFDFEKSGKSAKRLIDLLIKYKIPSTWAICGYLFKENDIINKLKSDSNLFELAYHSKNHFNYLYIPKTTVIKDIKFADYLRKKFNIKLESFVLPYNALAYISELINKGGFKNLRGYIGQYYQQKTIDFGDFKLFITSQFIGPKNIKTCLKNIENIIGKNFNYFTHPFNWQKEKDFILFEQFLKKLDELRKSGKIKIRLFSNI